MVNQEISILKLDKQKIRKQVVAHMNNFIRTQCYYDGWRKGLTSSRLVRGGDFLDLMAYYDTEGLLQLEAFYLGTSYDVLNAGDRKRLAIAMRKL